MTLQLPIVYKNNDLELFEMRNIFYGYKEYTCTLDSSSRLVVKDKRTNNVWGIQDLDEDTCVTTEQKCQVPYSGGDSAETFCLSAVLGSSTISEVRYCTENIKLVPSIFKKIEALFTCI